MRRLLALAALARVVSKETPPNGAPWRHSEVNGQRTLEVYQDGWGVAHYAAWDNDVATLEAVDGATLAARDAHGQAAVHVAAMAGHVAALEMLAARGAAGEVNGRGETAVAVAAQLGRATWLKRAGELGGTELLDAGSPPPAYLAARHGHGRAVDALGRGGADLGAVFRGWTPACAAAAEGHAAAIAALASLDAADDSGGTPEMVSIHQGHVDTLAIFTEARTKKLENRTSAPDDVGEEDEAGCGGWTWKTRLGWVALSVAASLSTVLVADAAEGKRRRAPPDDGRSAELQRALDAATSELRELGVEIDAERIARDAAEARAKDAEASRAAAAAAARTREAKTKEREAKLAGDLRDLRKRRDRDARAKDVDQLLGLDVSRLHVSVLTKLTQKIPALLHKVTREHLRREMAAANPAATSPRAHAEPDQASECIVCLEASREVAFGCGHLCVCDGCSTVVGECPICRAPITERRRIFSS